MAAAVVSSILRPRAEIVVPRVVGGILRSQAVFGRRVRDAFNRSMGVYQLLVDVDDSARTRYEARARTGRAAGGVSPAGAARPTEAEPEAQQQTSRPAA